MWLKLGHDQIMFLISKLGAGEYELMPRYGAQAQDSWMFHLHKFWESVGLSLTCFGTEVAVWHQIFSASFGSGFIVSDVSV